jgi:hypothetical protein
MKNVFAMRRANGDWFALDDEGSLRVPIFTTAADAMLARSRDFGMECFRPVTLDDAALTNLTTTDEGRAVFWLIEDPLRKLSLGRRLDRQQLVKLIQNGDKLTQANGGRK